jgi:hypothetical protein
VSGSDATPDPAAKPPARPHEREQPRETDSRGYHCDVCGASMHEWLCRIVCPNCGYQRDCEDP